MLPPWSENGYKEDGASLLEVHSDMMWNKGPKSEHSKFWLDIGKVFYHEVVKSCNSLSREIAGPLFPECTEHRTGKSVLIRYSSSNGCTKWLTEVLSNINHSMIPWLCSAIYIHIFSLVFSYLFACTKLTQQADLSNLSSVCSYSSVLDWKILCNFGTITVM